MSILSKLQSMLTAANTKTGESDTTLTDAVQTLVDGYGGGGGSVEHFLEPNQMIGTMTVDSEHTLDLATALTSVSGGTTVIGFCASAVNFKIILMCRRGNGNVSYATGFDADYATNGYSKASFTHNTLGIGDTYYLFTGNNF